MCRSDNKKLLNPTFHYTNEFDVLNEFVTFNKLHKHNVNKNYIYIYIYLNFDKNVFTNIFNVGLNKYVSNLD